jgi:ribonuclease E
MLDRESTGDDHTGTGPGGAADETTTPTRRTRRRTTKVAPATDSIESSASATGSVPSAPADGGGTDEPGPRRRRKSAPAKVAPAKVAPAKVAPAKVAPAKVAPAKVTPEKATSAEANLAGARTTGPADATPIEPAAGPTKATKAAKRSKPGKSGESTGKAEEVPETPRSTRSRRGKAAAAAAPTSPAAPSSPSAGPAISAGASAPVSPAAPATGPARSGGRGRARSAAPTSPAPVPARAASGENPAPVSPAAEVGTGGGESRRSRGRSSLPPTTAVFFVAPAEVAETPRRGAPASAPASPAAGPSGEAETEGGRSRRRRARRTPEEAPAPAAADADGIEAATDEDDETAAGRRRRRGRRGRGRGKGPYDGDEDADAIVEVAEEAPDDGEGGDEPLTRRRRHRRRRGTGGADPAAADGVVTVVRIREPRGGRDEVQGVTGSTRLEAKRQRRRDGREQRRTRPPILSESEFLARREAVDRVMVIRQTGSSARSAGRTQIAVLEDGILVEHYVTRQSASTMVGNVYLGKVQNVLPSMEAAFVDIGRGRNAVLYAGEVNWDSTGLEGKQRSIEQALRSGDSVLVQVTKDPVGHKGARLTSHIALSGRHLVYVPNGNASGISRKLSDVERRRLRDVLKNLVPDGAGVIVRTAAEGAAEDDLARDVKRLQAQWEDIQAKASDGGAPVLLYSEPDLVIRVVRDLFNEDFREVAIQGDSAHDEVEAYLGHVSPDLVARVRRHAGPSDVFTEWRIDEQILKGLDRKVYLPSGGHLVIDRTEAMTVIDVNTGKYTGAGGNLEETVTRNNLEAAEEIVRQLRLRDLGGIIVIDFIDMVLESNRELVLRRLTECLGRDRTKHQVTEITSLGLVQMTRKRIGQGLLEAFSEVCEHCKGRGLAIHTEPVAERPRESDQRVAEKVRAVASSLRGGTNGVAGEPSAGSETDDADDLELPDPERTDRDLDVGAVAEATDEDLGSSGRRRTRRGGARRRTRP